MTSPTKAMQAYDQVQKNRRSTSPATRR